MREEVFKEFQKLIYQESGIVLSAEKKLLLKNRVQKRLKELNVKEEEEYLKFIFTDLNGEELKKLLDVVSTNTTHFYREEAHFVVLSKVLKQYKEEGRKEIKIWCAASSTGEEPYTIAFHVMEAFERSSVNVRILASDISLRVLKTAVNGIYGSKEMENIPEVVRKRFFSIIQEDEEKKWSVNQAVKDLVTFKRFNLAKFPYSLRGPLDIIFCRNVMIYFDLPVREKIIKEFERLLSPGGLLFVSHSESLLGIAHSLKKLEPSVFQKE